MQDSGSPGGLILERRAAGRDLTQACSLAANVASVCSFVDRNTLAASVSYSKLFYVRREGTRWRWGLPVESGWRTVIVSSTRGLR